MDSKRNNCHESCLIFYIDILLLRINTVSPNKISWCSCVSTFSNTLTHNSTENIKQARKRIWGDKVINSAGSWTQQGFVFNSTLFFKNCKWRLWLKILISRTFYIRTFFRWKVQNVHKFIIPVPCGGRHLHYRGRSLQPCWSLVWRAGAAVAACTCFHV